MGALVSCQKRAKVSANNVPSQAMQRVTESLDSDPECGTNNSTLQTQNTVVTDFIIGSSFSQSQEDSQHEIVISSPKKENSSRRTMFKDRSTYSAKNEGHTASPTDYDSQCLPGQVSPTYAPRSSTLKLSSRLMDRGEGSIQSTHCEVLDCMDSVSETDQVPASTTPSHQHKQAWSMRADCTQWGRKQKREKETETAKEGMFMAKLRNPKWHGRGNNADLSQEPSCIPTSTWRWGLSSGDHATRRDRRTGNHDDTVPTPGPSLPRMDGDEFMYSLEQILQASLPCHAEVMEVAAVTGVGPRLVRPPSPGYQSYWRHRLLLRGLAGWDPSDEGGSEGDSGHMDTVEELVEADSSHESGQRSEAEKDDEEVDDGCPCGDHDGAGQSDVDGTVSDLNVEDGRQASPETRRNSVDYGTEDKEEDDDDAQKWKESSRIEAARSSRPNPDTLVKSKAGDCDPAGGGESMSTMSPGTKPSSPAQPLGTAHDRSVNLLVASIAMDLGHKAQDLPQPVSTPAGERPDQKDDDEKKDADVFPDYKEMCDRELSVQCHDGKEATSAQLTNVQKCPLERNPTDRDTEMRCQTESIKLAQASPIAVEMNPVAVPSSTPLGGKSGTAKTGDGCADWLDANAYDTNGLPKSQAATKRSSGLADTIVTLLTTLHQEGRKRQNLHSVTLSEEHPTQSGPPPSNSTVARVSPPASSHSRVGVKDETVYDTTDNCSAPDEGASPSAHETKHGATKAGLAAEGEGEGPGTKLSSPRPRPVSSHGPASAGGDWEVIPLHRVPGRTHLCENEVTTSLSSSLSAASPELEGARSQAAAVKADRQTGQCHGEDGCERSSDSPPDTEAMSRGRTQDTEMLDKEEAAAQLVSLRCAGEPHQLKLLEALTISEVEEGTGGDGIASTASKPPTGQALGEEGGGRGHSENQRRSSVIHDLSQLLPSNEASPNRNSSNND